MSKIILVSIFYILYSLFSPLQVSAQTQAWVDIESKCVQFEDVATIQGFECLVANLLNIVITLVGFGVFAMILFGGFQFLNSGGDPKAAEAGKQTITYAVIGLVLAISAWFILNLVSNFTGVNLLQFNTQVENVQKTLP